MLTSRRPGVDLEAQCDDDAIVETAEASRLSESKIDQAEESEKVDEFDQADESGQAEEFDRVQESNRIEHPGSWQIVLMTLLLLIVGLAAWRLYLRPPPVLDTTSLDALPLYAGSWSGEEIPMADRVSNMLAADFNVQRSYSHEIDGFVWFYLGYYGTFRGGSPEHTPPVCYRSQGWEILESSIVPLGSGDLMANELILERDGVQRLVRFWYQSYNRSGMLTAFDRALDRLQGLLLYGRSDGSLVRVSTPLAGSFELPIARARLSSFAREMVPNLARHWPNEHTPPG